MWCGVSLSLSCYVNWPTYSAVVSGITEDSQAQNSSCSRSWIGWEERGGGGVRENNRSEKISENRQLKCAEESIIQWEKLRRRHGDRGRVWLMVCLSGLWLKAGGSRLEASATGACNDCWGISMAPNSSEMSARASSSSFSVKLSPSSLFHSAESHSSSSPSLRHSCSLCTLRKVSALNYSWKCESHLSLCFLVLSE